MPDQFDDKIHNLIHDQKFLLWVIKPTEELNQYWNSYLLQNPGNKAAFDEARIIITGLVDKGNNLSEEHIVQLWDKIDNTIKSPRKIYFRLIKWTAAAIAVITIGIAGVLTYQWSENIPQIDYSSVARPELTQKDVTLFLSENQKETFSTNKVEIRYDENGVIKTSTGEVLSSENAETTKNDEKLNQLVVPFGKHSNIVLSDGTKLWLNSGSRAIYPVTFNKKKREIFIEGEAYMEVAHLADQPFYVKTDKVTIKVLGTKFNVSAYPEDRLSSVVLVEGSVQASVGKEEIFMKPNQVFAVEKKSGTFCLKQADVMEYISWKDGWLLCNKENLESINAKLARFYNIKIETTDSKINDLTLSGKLDLKSDFMDVFKTIALTAPIKYEAGENGTVRLSLK